MKKLLTFPVLLLLFVFVLKVLAPENSLDAAKDADLPPLHLQVGAKPVIYQPSKIGINLGRWSSWGTQQFANDLIMNPGFEGKLDRVIVIVSQADTQSFSDEAGWGYPDNYWREAEFTIRTGASQGKSGVITRSLNSGANGLPQYFSQESLPPIHANDVIVLTKVIRPTPIDNWSVNDEDLVQFDPYENRTYSSGNQSIKLTPSRTTPAALYQFADTAANKTGTMRPVKGAWRLTFWAKAEKPGAELEIAFQRTNGTPSFLKEVIYPTTAWQEYNLDFTGRDEGSPGPLKLSIVAVRPDISIWVDDVSLRPKEQGGVFRKEVIDALKILKPSFLREFAHLGDTWENRISSPFARKSFLYRQTGGQHDAIYSYSLESFLDLCFEIKANPWLIVPPTFSDYECREFGAFIAAKARKDRFSEVILEFGSDNWNWLNRPVGIPYYKEHGRVADRSFKIIAEEAKNASNIRFLINGQYSSPENSLKFMDFAKTADGLSVAPYFFHQLDKGTPDEEVLELLFNQNLKTMQSLSDELFSRGKSIAVSEINLHTTEGTAKAYERNRVVAGTVSGSALAKNILKAMYAGADPILINALGQYDTPAWDINEDVLLWGVVRDFGPPLLFRPTGLAMMMLNQVIGGNMYSIKEQDKGDAKRDTLTMAAFKAPNGWSAAIVSRHNAPLNLNITFPDDGGSLPQTVLTLESGNPFDTNEDRETVKIAKRKTEINGRVVNATVPPWGFITLSQ